jgi:hypothetical protein
LTRAPRADGRPARTGGRPRGDEHGVPRASEATPDRRTTAPRRVAGSATGGSWRARLTEGFTDVPARPFGKIARTCSSLQRASCSGVRLGGPQRRRPEAVELPAGCRAGYCGILARSAIVGGRPWGTRPSGEPLERLLAGPGVAAVGRPTASKAAFQTPNTRRTMLLPGQRARSRARSRSVAPVRLARARRARRSSHSARRRSPRLAAGPSQGAATAELAVQCGRHSPRRCRR